jgi:hypothetical protein
VYTDDGRLDLSANVRKQHIASIGQRFGLHVLREVLSQLAPGRLARFHHLQPNGRDLFHVSYFPRTNV